MKYDNVHRTYVPDFDAPRCSWLEGMINRELYVRQQRDFIQCTPAQMDNLMRSRARYGYDPYNSVNVLVTNWLKAA